MVYIGMAAAVLVAGIATWASGYWVIPYLRKIKFGQVINEIGPRWHKNKQGTPTMGGFMFIFGCCLGILAGYPFLAGAVATMLPNDFGLLILGMFTTLAFAAVGFLDDYLKVVRKQNLGLRARGKLAMQCVIGVCFLVTLHMMHRLSTIVLLPFVGAINLGWAFYPIALVLLVGMVNAVNLTDGIDGLAGGVTFWVMAGYFVLLVLAQRWQLGLWAAAMMGGCVGYLVWNMYPAKVFMGDTGSMFLGGAVAVMGFCMGAPEVMIILGLVYLVEAGSVMLQVAYFKLTHGKRIFRMSPIHHHFEMGGWSENKIVAVFSFVAMLCAALALAYWRFVM